MSAIWVDAVCADCGHPLFDKDKTIAVIPSTMREKASYQSGYKPCGDLPQLRVMPGKGRKGKQQRVVFHEACWPGFASPAGK